MGSTIDAQQAAIKEGLYMIQNHASIGQLAKRFKLRRSTISYHINILLRTTDYELWKKCQEEIDRQYRRNHVSNKDITDAVMSIFED